MKLFNAKDHGDHDGDGASMDSVNSKEGVDIFNSAKSNSKGECSIQPTTNFDPLSYNGGPITRARAKKMKEAIMGLILPNLEPILKSTSQLVKGQSQQVKGQLMDPSPSPTLVHLIQVQARHLFLLRKCMRTNVS